VTASELRRAALPGCSWVNRDGDRCQRQTATVLFDGSMRRRVCTEHEETALRVSRWTRPHDIVATLAAVSL
jgi:hypothetical protein